MDLQEFSFELTECSPFVYVPPRAFELPGERTQIHPLKNDNLSWIWLDKPLKLSIGTSDILPRFPSTGFNTMQTANGRAKRMAAEMNFGRI